MHFCFLFLLFHRHKTSNFNIVYFLRFIFLCHLFLPDLPGFSDEGDTMEEAAEVAPSRGDSFLSKRSSNSEFIASEESL
jgi:hypothetical protein